MQRPKDDVYILFSATILKHIDPNDCLGRLAIVQKCVSIWYQIVGPESEVPNQQPDFLGVYQPLPSPLMYCGGTRAFEQICKGMRGQYKNVLKQLEVSYYLKLWSVGRAVDCTWL